MSEENPEDDETLVVEGEVATGNITIGDQSFAYADVRIRVEDAAHHRRVEQQRLDHELQEETRDNYARRMRESREDRARHRRETITFLVFIGVPIAGLIFAAALAVWTTEESTRQFAQNLISLIFGGILGGLTGYFTGRSGE
jgi:hypothetical protein